jgi:predicted esterase
LLLCTILLGRTAEGQTYQELRDSAARIRDKGDYITAFTLLTRGMRLARHPYHNDVYDAAALATLAGLNDSALAYLTHLLNERELSMIIDQAREDREFARLQTDERWQRMYRQAVEMRVDRDIRKIAAVDNCIRDRDRMNAYSDSVLAALSSAAPTGQQLVRLLKGYDRFPPIEARHRNDLWALPVEINDSTVSFYAVQLPRDYDPSIPCPLLLVLHGAVYINMGFPDPTDILNNGSRDTTGMNQFFSQFGYRYHIIVVYPHANRDFNWMHPDDGFGMVPKIVKSLKRMLNIDDNKVFISGHSNGATGVVSYLLKSPSLFAGFYGFNSNPRIQTGGTFIRNALNRSYFNVATDKDYYFPVSGHDTLRRLAMAMGIDWQNHVYYGFPHWFPQFKESSPAFQLMFDDMTARTRNPFHHDLYWECDDNRHGRCDWIGIDELDTLAAKKDWQQQVNFSVTHWIDNRDTSKVSDTVIQAFIFPRLSGAVRAHYAGNRFDLTTSRVKALSIFVSPEMVDMTRPVMVYLNGKEVFNGRMHYDRRFMLESFRENFDRKAVWVNRIRLQE